MSDRTPTRQIVALSIGGCGSAAALRICDPLLPYLAREYDVVIHYTGTPAQLVRLPEHYTIDWEATSALRGT